MLDRHIRPFTDARLIHACGFLHRRSVTPNQITWLGFSAACLCFIFLYMGLYLPTLLFVAINRILDGLDGVYARYIDTNHPLKGISGQSDFGGYLDIVLDFIFYAGFVFFFALHAPEAYAIAAAFLLFSFMGSGCSFLAYAIIATKRNISCDLPASHKKSFYYLSGLTEGTETIFCFVLCCLLPQYFNIIAIIFGGMCWVTTMTRILAAKDHFAHKKSIE